jgi:2-polyprenyl-6-methoxyphenol hydroxylase-like FAD-dependent oxidoreductase
MQFPWSKALDLVASDVHRLAHAAVRSLDPSIGRIVAEAEIDATFAVRVTSARPVPPWRQDTPAVTLLGDAVHTMSPGRGEGATVALRDAQGLRAAIRAAASGRTTLADATGAYQSAMLEYGFAAVEASRHRPFVPARP